MRLATGRDADLSCASTAAVLPRPLLRPSQVLAAVRTRRDRPRLATMHRSSIQNAEAVLRDEAVIVSGSLAALGRR